MSVLAVAPFLKKNIARFGALCQCLLRKINVQIKTKDKMENETSKQDETKALHKAHVSGNEALRVALPSDDEMKSFAKKWAESFEGKEQLAMESAHYCGQAYIRNKIGIIMGIPNGL